MNNKYTKETITDMANRIRKFIQKNQRLPNTCKATTMQGQTVNLTQKEYNGLFETCNNFAIKNNRYPNYVTQTVTAQNPLVIDIQDTSYTCGPTSLSMASQLLYNWHSEQTMKTLCRTNKNGTSPQQLIDGAKKSGIKMTQIPRTITAVKQSLNKCQPVIAHIDTIRAGCLGYSTKKNWGHWILLWQVDAQKFRVADPTKGLKTVNAQCIINAQYGRTIHFYSCENI